MNWSRRRMVFRLGNLLCVMFLLLVVSAANASPTIPQQDVVLTAKASPTDTPISLSRSVPDIVGPMAQLADLGREFLQPPPASAALSSTQGNLVKALPAIPATVFMALIGFLCVSLYRDRRVWLTALAGLLWAGQAGIEALPQLALRLSYANHGKQQPYAELTHPYYLENSHRLRCDIEGTQYISLLHHLAGIPDSKSVSANRHLNTLITFSQNHRKPYRKTFSYSRKNTHICQPAVILEQCSLNSLFKCSASRAGRFICFSPAFIFENLPRGPPIPA